MANTRIQDEGFQKFSQQLMDSAGALSSLGGEFRNTVEGASNAWEGDAAKRWGAFGNKAGEAHDQMLKTLEEIQQKIQDVAEASRAGQSEQEDVVALAESKADYATIEGNFAG